MDISINAEVFCTDGDCGHVTHVLINPVTRKVTHLIVKEHGILGQRRMVPVEFMIHSTPEKIKLSLDKASFHHLENFISIKYVGGEKSFDVYLPEQYFMHPLLVPDDDFDYTTHYIKGENIPEGELAISHGSEVYAKDGPVGKVGEFLVSSQNDKITHIILQEGHIWNRKQITIPVSAIEHIEVDGVHLKLSKEAISELPDTPVRNS